MNNDKKLLYTTLGAIATVYVMGVSLNSKDLSDKLEPLRDDFKHIVETTKPKVNLESDGAVRVFDYGGKLDPIVDAKNEYAKDNGAFPLAWRVKQGTYDVPRAQTPSPLVLNPLKWNFKIDDSAIKNYERNNKYRNRK